MSYHWRDMAQDNYKLPHIDVGQPWWIADQAAVKFSDSGELGDSPSGGMGKHHPFQTSRRTSSRQIR